MSKTADSPAPEGDQQTTVGKGRKTPTRAEQEAARRRPIAPNTKEARKEQAAKRRAEMDRRRAGEAAGEERYLLPRDKGPQRRYARDYVDAGWHIGEFAMPALLVVVLVSLVIPVYEASFYSFLAMIILMLLVAGDMVILSRTVKKKIAAKFGESRLESGLGWYAAMRSMQMRFMRIPKPQVKRGEWPS